MKRFLAYFCCIFTLLGQSFSCLANDNIVGSTEAGNIMYGNRCTRRFYY